MIQSGFSTLILISSVRIMAIPSVSLALCHSAGKVRACLIAGHLQKNRDCAKKSRKREITDILCLTWHLLHQPVHPSRQGRKHATITFSNAISKGSDSGGDFLQTGKPVASQLRFLKIFHEKQQNFLFGSLKEQMILHYQWQSRCWWIHLQEFLRAFRDVTLMMKTSESPIDTNPWVKPIF